MAVTDIERLHHCRWSSWAELIHTFFGVYISSDTEAESKAVTGKLNL